MMRIWNRAGLANVATISLLILSLLVPAHAADPASESTSQPPLIVLAPELKDARAQLGTLVEQLYGGGEITACARDSFMQLLESLNAMIKRAMLGKEGWTLLEGTSTVTRGSDSNKSYDSNYRQATSSYEGHYQPSVTKPQLNSLTIIQASDGTYFLTGNGFSDEELVAMSNLVNEQGLAALDWAHLFPAEPSLAVDPPPVTP